MGLVKPKASIDFSIWRRCWRECILALLAYGLKKLAGLYTNSKVEIEDNIINSLDYVTDKRIYTIDYARLTQLDFDCLLTPGF